MNVPHAQEVVDLMRRRLVGQSIDGEDPAIVVDSIELTSEPRQWPASVVVRFRVAGAPPRPWRWSRRLDRYPYEDARTLADFLAGNIQIVLREWLMTRHRRPEAWRDIQPDEPTP